jgi:hypothetical protein
VPVVFCWHSSAPPSHKKKKKHAKKAEGYSLSSLSRRYELMGNDGSKGAVPAETAAPHKEDDVRFRLT